MAGRGTIDDAAIGDYIRNPGGDVGRALLVTAEDIRARTVASLKTGFPRDWLGPSVVKRTVKTANGFVVRVGSDRTMTRPHLIVGKPYLAFTGRDGTLVVLDARRNQIVHHPGSNMAPYLRKKLLEALDKTEIGK